MSSFRSRDLSLPRSCRGHQLDAIALIHEIGHVFGAEHVTDTTSIMHEHFDYRTEFDVKNRAVILENRNCPFAK